MNITVQSGAPRQDIQKNTSHTMIGKKVYASIKRQIALQPPKKLFFSFQTDKVLKVYPNILDTQNIELINNKIA